MQPMTVTEIASAVKGVWWNPSEQVPVVSAVSTDSRRIVPGSLFLPWVGEKFDGHLFIDAALDAGAAGCLCAKLPQRAGGGTGTFSQIHQKKAAILFQKRAVAG